MSWFELHLARNIRKRPPALLHPALQQLERRDVPSAVAASIPQITDPVTAFEAGEAVVQNTLRGSRGAAGHLAVDSAFATAIASSGIPAVIAEVETSAGVFVGPGAPVSSDTPFAAAVLQTGFALPTLEAATFLLGASQTVIADAGRASPRGAVQINEILSEPITLLGTTLATPVGSLAAPAGPSTGVGQPSQEPSGSNFIPPDSTPPVPVPDIPPPPPPPAPIIDTSNTSTDTGPTVDTSTSTDTTPTDNTCDCTGAPVVDPGSGTDAPVVDPGSGTDSPVDPGNGIDNNSGTSL